MVATLSFTSALSEGDGGRYPITQRNLEPWEPIPQINGTVTLRKIPHHVAERIRVIGTSADFKVQDVEYDYSDDGLLENITVLVLTRDFFVGR